MDFQLPLLFTVRTGGRETTHCLEPRSKTYRGSRSMPTVGGRAVLQPATPAASSLALLSLEALLEGHEFAIMLLDQQNLTSGASLGTNSRDSILAKSLSLLYLRVELHL